jgi:MoxR-like ATPase
MDATPDYFHSSHREDMAEVRRTLEPIQTVLRVFEDHFEQSIRGWPYSVSSEPTRSGFSNSTNAMISFALLATCGLVRRSVLLPITRPVDVPGAFDDNRRKALRKLIIRSLDTIASVMSRPPRRVQLVSGTFGINDPFTITWLVEVNAILRAASEDVAFTEKTAQLKALVRDVFRRIPPPTEEIRVLNLPKDPSVPSATLPFEVSHPFPLLRIAHLREAARQMGITAPARLNWLSEWFTERLRSNLADSVISDSPSDAADLVFSLEGLLASNRTPDESMTDAVFRVLRESQARNAYWRPLRPFIATRQGHTLLPLSIEVANSLLRCCDRLDSDHSERSFFSENLSLFKRYAQWLRSRLVQVTVGGQNYFGWHSENTLSENTIDLWETSQVVVFLLLYADLLKRHIARATLTAARLSMKRPHSDASRPEDHWEKKAIPKEPLYGLEPKRQVFRQVGEHFVRPRQPGSRATASHSMLLYGPPGTGKTGIAEDLAAALGKRLITITPSDFLAEGPNEVEGRAKVIFDALLAQADCVILFDEIDRLLLDRDAPMYHKQSDAFQFMTPSMLVKLKDLRSAEQTIFIIATNYYERIDPAARRVGRVDHRYLVMPPNREQRRRIVLDRTTAEAPRNGSLPRPSGPMFRQMLDRTALYAFSELKSLVRDALAGQQPRTGNEVARLLLRAAEEGEPTIRAATYRDRFHVLLQESRQEVLTTQQPIEEFIGILELLQESGRLREAQPEAGKVLEAMESEIREEDMKRRANRLLREIRRGTRT